MSTLSIKTLGGLTIAIDGEAPTGFASRKAELLLVYLACDRRAHPREMLAELLWDERTQQQAMANLRVVLSSLRKAVGAFVTITRHDARIAQDAPVSVDATRLEDIACRVQSTGGIVGSAMAAEVEAATAIYDGDFLAGIFVPEASGFEAWMTAERERLHRLATVALRELAAWRLAQGDCIGAIATATRLTDVDDLAEAGFRLLMEALARSGQRAAALKVYEQCRQHLDEALGMEPARRTTEVYEQILAGQLRFAAEPQPHVHGYQLKEAIGRGKYGVIHRAIQPGVGREVAVKVIRRKYADDPAFIRRFEAEAQLVARLEHPYIVPIYDYWRDPEGAYLVMRYLHGGSVADVLRRNGAFAPESAASILDHVAAALRVAHDNDIIHGRLKPSNILLDEGGNAYLADFGFARMLALAGADSEPIVSNAPWRAYLAPEQLRHEPATPETDIYGLGLTLYVMLGGHLPSPPVTSETRATERVNGPLPPLSALGRDIAEPVNRIISKATAPDPQRRYDDPLTMAEAFHDAVSVPADTGAALLAQLTPREFDILERLAAGLSNQEIADELVISVATVKWYNQQIYDKLDVANRVQAGLRAQQLKLVDQVEPAPAPLSVTTDGQRRTLENPYKGLHAFQEADADDFFGREALVQQLVTRLGNAESRFLAVIGPSGSGKSSAVKAGLIPALRAGALPGADKWFITEMVPGTNPLAELELALWPVAVDPPPNLVAPMQRDTGGLLRTVRRILPPDPASPQEGPQLLLVIDQFEELYTLVEDETERSFFLNSLLAALIAPRSPLRVVVTLRADFYDRPLQDQEWGQLLKHHSEVVLPLNRQELTQAIREPAARVGVRLEEGLVASIVADVAGQPGTLPLLQYAMTELFEHRQGNCITRTDYEQLGGVLGALGRRAEAVYAKLDDAGQELTRQLFLRLITLGEGVEDTRRRVLRAELEALATPTTTTAPVDGHASATLVLQRFGDARFLTFDRDPRTRAPTVEVAHEALLREWERLRQWLDESRDDMRLQRRLARAAQEWSAAGEDPSFLLRGARLEQFDGWAQTTALALTAAECGYLQASLELRDAEAQAETERLAWEARLERRARTVLRVLVAVFALAAIIAGALAFAANNQRQRAEASEQDAQTQAAVLLAAQAETELNEGFSDRAILLALEALEHYPYTSQAEHALGQAVSFNRALQRYAGHGSAVTSIDWSPDGTRIATSSTDNTVHVWDARTAEERLIIELPQGITRNVFDWALTVKWTPDGSRLLTLSGDRFLTGGQDYDMILWDATTGERLSMIALSNQAEPQIGEEQFTGAEHFATATAADFAPASGRLVTVGGDNTAIIWDDALEAPRLVLTGHENAINSVDWSPDEARLATASEDGTARIWDAHSGEELLLLAAHEGAVNQVAWSPDGSKLATAGKDGTVRFWDATSGALIFTLETNGGVVWSLAWSPDGRYLATGTNDALIRLWEVSSGEAIAILRGHDNFVYDVVWSPRDDRLATADGVGLVYVWNAAPSTAVLNLPSSYYGELGWSSDGRYLALSTGDWWAGAAPPNLSVWDVMTGQLEAKFGSREGWFFGRPDYSPDDNLLLLQSFKGPSLSVSPAENEPKAFVVNAHTGADVKTFALQGEGFFIRTTFWSPDGRRIAAGTSTGKLVAWDYQSGDLLLTRECGDFVGNLAWSPDGTRLAASCLDVTAEAMENGRIEIFDAATGAKLMTLTDPTTVAGSFSVTWSPDGTRLLTTGGNDQTGTHDNPVIVWDAKTGEPLLRIMNHTGQVWSGSWSPDGTRIASGSTDDTTRIWDATTGAELLTLPTPSNWEVSVAWSPNGQYLAISTYSFDVPGKAEVWRVWQSTEELIQYAYDCCVFRELTPEERAQFGLAAEP